MNSSMNFLLVKIWPERWEKECPNVGRIVTRKVGGNMARNMVGNVGGRITRYVGGSMPRNVNGNMTRNVGGLSHGAHHQLIL